MAVAQSTPAPFVWGPNGEMLTPDEVEKMRQQAEALKAAGMDYSPVGSWLEGLARVAQAGAGAYKEYRANNAQKEGQQAWNDKYGGIIGSLMGGGATASPMASYAPSATQDQMRSDAGITGTQANAGDAFASVAPRLIGDLSKDFGLSPEQAAGVVGQLGHESAGFGTLQEVNPTIPGSRGGYGYAQWTGPRRQAFEQYAQANGLDPASYEANYGFLANELRNTPEGAVLKDVAAAPDALTAGRVFTDKFLRPGVPGYDSRDSWTQKALAYADPSLMPAQAELEGMAAPQAAAPSPQAREVALALAAPQGGQMPAQAAQPQRPVNTAGLNYDPATGAIGPAANLGPGATLAPAASQAFLGNGRGGSWSDPIRAIAQSLAGGGQSAGAQGAPQAMPAPQGAMPAQPPQPSGMPQGNNLNALIAAASDPYAPPGVKEIVNTLVQQQLQQQDPAYRMGLEKSQLELEQLRNPKMKPIEVGGVLLDPTTYQPIYDSRQQNVPDSVTALDERAKRAGLQPGTPEYQRFMLSGGDKGIEVNVDTGTIPQGYQAVRDDNGRLVRYEPVPGGPADTSASKAAKADSRMTITDIVTNAASLAREAATSGGLPTTGVAGRVAANLPETSAAEVRRQVAVLKSNATIENIAAMRAASPTGGALGSLTEKEGEMLAAKAGALDPDSPNFLRDLDDYEQTLLRTVHGYEAGTKMFEQTRPQKPSPVPTGNSRSTLGLDRKPPVVINGYQIEEVN